MRHYEKGPGNRVSPHGNHGDFFVGHLDTSGKLYENNQLFCIFLPQKLHYTCTRSQVLCNGTFTSASIKDGYIVCDVVILRS